jgi:hypothetical protein
MIWLKSATEFYGEEFDWVGVFAQDINPGILFSYQAKAPQSIRLQE